MSEDYEDDEVVPKRSPQQQRIADLMYRENKSYDEAYRIVVLGEKPKKFDWYDPTPTPQPQPKARQFSIANLEDLANSIDAELEDISTKKATLREKAAKFQEKRNKLVEVATSFLEQEKSLEKRLEQQDKNEVLFKDAIANFNKEVDNYNNLVKQLAEASKRAEQKRKGFVRQINVEAEKEFKS